MIFPTEALRALRQQLRAQIEAGETTEVAAYRRSREADPDDFISILHLLDDALTRERHAEAEKLGWELLRTSPAAPHSYLMFTTVLERRHPHSKLPMQFMLLGLEMLLHDPAALEEFTFEDLLDDELLQLIDGLAKRDAMRVVLNCFRQRTGQHSSSPEVAPYRHILALRAAGSGPVERSEADAILRDAERVAPLLRGVLKQYAEGELTDEVVFVERAITLLGEMGDPAVVGDLGGFLLDDALVNPAMWAYWRIASRRPADTLEQIRRMIPESDPFGRFVAAHYLVQLPRTPGQVEALESVLEGIGEVPREHRSAILSTALAGIYVLDGPDSGVAAALELRYDRLLTKKVRKHLMHIRDLRRKTGPEEPPGFETTIYDVCCTGLKRTNPECGNVLS